MRIMLINGSPKRKDSASGRLLDFVRDHLQDKAEIIGIGLHAADEVSEDTVKELQQADACVISCPLYVDGIPGHLLQALVALDAAQIDHPSMHVYGIVNCGFYEGIQAEFALQVMRNWADKAGFVWGGGIGVGGGGAIASLPAEAQPVIASVRSGLDALADAMMQGGKIENAYVTIGFPRFLYRFAAQQGWRQAIRQNGGRAKDLGRIPEE